MKTTLLALCTAGAIAMASPAAAAVVLADANYTFAGSFIYNNPPATSVTGSFSISNGALSALSLDIAGTHYDTTNASLENDVNLAIGGNLTGVSGVSLGTNDFRLDLYLNNGVLAAGGLIYTVTGSQVPFATDATLTRVDSAVPEPATWAMMLLGFGGIGFQLRRKRSALLQEIAQIGGLYA